jgi:predicted transcriptional regulator
VTDYRLLQALREQALRTRLMVLEDAIRQFLRGNETIAQLAMALDDRMGEWIDQGAQDD